MAEACRKQGETSTTSTAAAVSTVEAVAAGAASMEAADVAAAQSCAAVVAVGAAAVVVVVGDGNKAIRPDVGLDCRSVYRLNYRSKRILKNRDTALPPCYLDEAWSSRGELSLRRAIDIIRRVGKEVLRFPHRDR